LFGPVFFFSRIPTREKRREEDVLVVCEWTGAVCRMQK
jgi:hypothetical protein